MNHLDANNLFWNSEGGKWKLVLPESQWEHTHSIRVMKQLMGGRMYPLTLEGLDRAMRELVR